MYKPEAISPCVACGALRVPRNSLCGKLNEGSLLSSAHAPQTSRSGSGPPQGYQAVRAHLQTFISASIVIKC